jgi:hypothetical protein
MSSAVIIALTPVLALVAGVAQAANNVGWVLADQKDADDYMPDAQHSFNSAGGAITIIRGGTGAYGVHFDNLYDGAMPNVQVSAYNSSGWCNLTGIGSDGKTAEAGVYCYDAHGTLVNTEFTLLYQSRNAPFGTTDRGVAFLYASPLTTSVTQTPPAATSFNSTGGTNTLIRNSMGNYTVTLPGLTKFFGNAQVVGQRTTFRTPLPRCKLVSWGTGASSTNITVQCYNYAGLPRDDLQFYLAYSVDQTLGFKTGIKPLGAYAFANDLTSTSVYTPNTKDQFNGFGTGKLTAQKTGTGLYTVTIPGTLNYSTSVALVTAVGPASAAYCNIVSWATSTINVACFKTGGTPIDSRFEVSFQTATVP